MGTEGARVAVWGFSPTLDRVIFRTNKSAYCPFIVVVSEGYTLDAVEIEQRITILCGVKYGWKKRKKGWL